MMSGVGWLLIDSFVKDMVENIKPQDSVRIVKNFKVLFDQGLLKM